MSINPIARTLAAFGFHAQPRTGEDGAFRAVFTDAEGESPTPAAPPPPARIPPHQRHLYVRHNEIFSGYSMGAYRPAASMLDDPRPEKKAVKPRKRAKASPKHA